MLLSEGTVGDPFLLSNYSQMFTKSFIHQTSVNDRVCNMKFRKKNFQAGLTVVNASTVNTFKARLDKFWSHQVVK